MRAVYYGWNTMGNLTNWIWIIFIIIWIVSDCAVLSIQSNDVGAGHGFTYSRDRLLFLRGSIHCQLNPSILIPLDITLTSGLRRKRGRRGGVRCRLRRRPFKTPLPSIILSNVRSLKTNWTCYMQNVSRMHRSGRHVGCDCVLAGWVSSGCGGCPRRLWAPSSRQNQ